jgi:hypothetical protein
MDLQDWKKIATFALGTKKLGPNRLNNNLRGNNK